jgi:hypothetical protein
MVADARRAPERTSKPPRRLLPLRTRDEEDALDDAHCITVGGRTVLVRTSLAPSDLGRVAALVDEKFSTLSGSTPKRAPADTWLLVAMALAHDLVEERAASRARDGRTEEQLAALIARVDALLASVDRPIE